MKNRPLSISRRLAATCSVLLATLMLGGTAHAAFLPIDDFDSLVLGPIDDQNGWQAASESSAVVVDPDGGTNQVLQVVTESTHLHHEVVILDDTVRMLFLRFRYEDQLNFSLGMSEATYPSQIGHFDAELNMASAIDELRINDGGTYSVLTTLVPGTWYNAWLLIDNDDDVTAVWLHDRPGESAKPGDRLSVEDQMLFSFRDATVGDLRTFYVKTGGGSGVLGPLFIDDLYLEDTDVTNLDNPTGPATSVAVTPSPLPALGVQPNPFNPRTTVTFDLPTWQYTEVTVHDLAGRTVAVLVAADLAPGEHALLWNGRDRSGREASSGLYLVRLRTAAGTQARKILLAR